MKEGQGGGLSKRRNLSAMHSQKNLQLIHWNLWGLDSPSKLFQDKAKGPGLYIPLLISN